MQSVYIQTHDEYNAICLHGHAPARLTTEPAAGTLHGAPISDDLRSHHQRTSRLEEHKTRTNCGQWPESNIVEIVGIAGGLVKPDRRP